MRKKFAAASCAALVTMLTAGSALAGEVKGPPGSPGNGSTNYTPIENDVAASACSYNGLNDFDQGQQLAITQNYGTNIQLGLNLGFPGTGCNPAISPPGLS